MRGDLVLLFALLSAQGNALVIKRFPQDSGMNSVDPSTPTSTTLDIGSNPESPSTSTTEPPPGSTPPATLPGSFDFSQCPATSSCQQSLLDFVAGGVCDKSIEDRGRDCVYSCTGGDGLQLEGVQDAVNSVITAYYETCANAGTCLLTSTYAFLPQLCRDRYPLVTENNIYGWDRTYACLAGDQGETPVQVEGEKPTACVSGSGGTPASLDCVATQCNAFLVRASPSYPNPCQADTVTLANGCDQCGGATVRAAGGLQTYISTLESWCKAAPQCFDFSTGAAITDGACASVQPPGGSDTTTVDQRGGSTTTPPGDTPTTTDGGSSPPTSTSAAEPGSSSIAEASDPSLLTTTLSDGTLTTLSLTTATDNAASPEVTTISGVVFTLSPSSAQTTILPDGSTLTLPPASAPTTTALARPTLSGQSINTNGTRRANTAFASATTTSAAAGRRLVGAGTGLLCIAVGVIVLL